VNDKMKAYAAQVAAMTEGERADVAARMPIVTIEGHALSVRNNVLCAIQASAPVTVVGGFRQWIAHGRCVRKGEHALYILRPCEKKSDDADGETSRFFLSVPVFDVAQTDVLPTPADLVETRQPDPAGFNPLKQPRPVPAQEYYSEQFRAL